MQTHDASRQEFLTLARQTLEHLDADTAQLDQASTRDPETEYVELRLVRDDAVEFALSHSVDPAINRLLLVECVLGPIPDETARTACERLLVANEDLSSLQLTGFAIDAVGHAIYTHSCAIRNWNASSIADLIDGMAALAAHWREDGLAALDDAGSLPSATPGSPSMAYA